MTQTDNFTPVEGPSFPVVIKLLATGSMGGLLVTAWGARTQLAAIALPPDLMWLASLAAAVVIWHYLHIVFSTTAISGDTLSQGWLWRSRVALRDIAQVKLLRVKWLDAVVAPRLVVRTRGVGNLTFHAADPAVLAVIDLLVHGQAELQTVASTP
jgi:hypothetical protein